MSIYMVCMYVSNMYVRVDYCYKHCTSKKMGKKNTFWLSNYHQLCRNFFTQEYVDENLDLSLHVLKLNN